jgi:hypothetical protein
MDENFLFVIFISIIYSFALPLLPHICNVCATVTLLENACWLSFKDSIRGLQDLLKENIFPVYFLGVHFDLCCFPCEQLVQLDLLAGTLVLLSTIQWPGSVWCFATPDSSLSFQHPVKPIHPEDGGSVFLRNHETFNHIFLFEAKVQFLILYVALLIL